jgi:hypothetical protein
MTDVWSSENRPSGWAEISELLNPRMLEARLGGGAGLTQAAATTVIRSQ